MVSTTELAPPLDTFPFPASTGQVEPPTAEPPPCDPPPLLPSTPSYPESSALPAAPLWAWLVLITVFGVIPIVSALFSSR